jgi:hypothetical protein
VEDQAGLRRIVSADVPVGAAADRDVTLDDLDVDVDGRWDAARPLLPASGTKRYSDVFLGSGLTYDMTIGGKTAKFAMRFQPKLSAPGRYLICFGYRPFPHQASNLNLSITCNGITTTQTVNEQAKDSPFPLVSLGEFRCTAGTDSYVDVDNTGADGRVAVDGMRWVWVGD